MEYEKEHFWKAATKEELCSSYKTRTWDKGVKLNEWNDYCMKSKSDNIIICPKNLINNRNIKKQNRIFTKLIKTSKQYGR